MPEREVRFLSSLARRLAIGLVLLPFCAAAAAPPSPEKSRVQAPDDAAAAPELMAYAPLRMLLLSADDAAGPYYSVVSKATFAIDSRGRLSFLDHGGEPLVDAKADPTVSYDCRAHGASYNQRTTWFPYTALFVRGGTLMRIDGGKETQRPLRPLSADAESGGATMAYAGPGARAPEYGFAPCVGPHRVAAGSRLDGYLATSDRIAIRDAAGKRVSLALPQPFAPFVLARYRSGAIVPVPMRIVVATIDLAERRVVLQFQATLARTPAPRKLELRAVLDDGKPDPDESAARYRVRTQALLGDLARCAPPRVHAIEPCADPRRLADPRVFFSVD